MAHLEESAKKRILISVPPYFSSIYLPYVYGLLRQEAERDPLIQDHYAWLDPIYLFAEPQRLLAPYRGQRIDVLGLSCYDWNWELQIEIARQVKAESPHTLVVMGGPEPPYRDKGFFDRHPFVDVIVKEDGELAFARILKEALKEEPDFASIPGLVLPGKDGACSTGEVEKIKDFGPVSPYVQYPFFEELIERHRSNLRFAAFWETNRGCPYKCRFCDWGSNTFSKVRLYPMERLRSEVEWFSRHQINRVFIADANFGMFPRDVEITEMLIEARQKTGFPADVHWMPAKNQIDRVREISERFYGAGLLHSVIVGFQSTQDQALQVMERMNLGQEKHKKVIRGYREKGIPLTGVLIMACPGESAREFRQSLHDLLEMGFHDEIRTHLYSILPNAPAASPEYMNEHGIEVIERPMNQQRVDRSLIKNPFGGRSHFIVGHKTLDQAGLKDEMCYAVHIFLNHNFALSRFMAIFLNQEFGISYARFYGEYYAYLRGHKTLVGEAFIGVDQKMEEFFKDPDTHLVFDLGKGAALYEPEEYALHLTLGNLGRYFEELAQFLDGFLESKVKRDPRYQDLLGFQRQVIVTEDYDPRLGREFTCRYDWANYFCSDATPVKLLPVGYRLVANDTHRGFGLSQMKIKWHEMDTPGERFWNFFATVVCHRYYRYNTTNLTSFRRELAKEVSPEDLLAQ